jgi:hypothetical protein
MRIYEKVGKKAEKTVSFLGRFWPGQGRTGKFATLTRFPVKNARII